MRHCFKLLLLTTALMAWFATSAQEAKPQPVPEAAAPINLEQIKPEPVKQKAFDTKMVSVPQAEAISTQSEARVETKVSTKVKRPASEININGKGVNSSSSAKKSPRRADAVTVSLPSGVTAESWVITTNFFANSTSGDAVNYSYRSNVQVAFDGNDIYIAGLSYWLPNAWVKGTIDGETATFPTGQYYGIDGDDELWFVGYGEDGVCDVTFSYNATTRRLTLDNNITILEGSDTEGSYYAYHINTTITKPDEETVASGTATNQYVPVYGYYIDTNSTESQMIYPASYFDGLSEGSRISSITFYGNSNIPANLGYSTIDVYIGETSATTIASSTAMTSNRNASTLVYEGTLPTGEKTMTITFATPYTYNGGNIVIDTYVKTASSQYSNYSGWVGQSQTQNTSYYYRSSTDYGGVKFLPKLTIEYIYPPKTQAIDFGTVEVGSSKTINAKVELVGPTTSSTNTPFSTGTPTSHAKYTSIPVTFTPTAANVYNGTLNVEAGGKTITVLLKGVGNITGSPEAIRDEAFFEGITYKWTDSDGEKHTSNLAEIATDPDQMIAMIREVYTNRTIPGNYRRGYTTARVAEGDAVNYGGVGTISLSWSGSNGTYSYEDGYGWGIPGSLKTGSSTSSISSSMYGTAYYCYMDPTQYKPYNEGVTLLLVEMVDDFDKAKIYDTEETEPYKQLRDYITNSIKSIRVVSQATRTGVGTNEAGTLFKVDCDKMNKFYFIAKGQLRWIYNSVFAKDTDNENLLGLFCADPCYIYNSSSYNSIDGFFDNRSFPLFYNMFEEFSPVANDAEAAKADIYQDLVNMESFGVEHDCMGVPMMGHQFMMYGDDSDAADCQDVRDMMFFVPDYRMMSWSDRDSKNNPNYQKFMNYNTTYPPKMGLYVIRQDEIVPTTEADDYYMLTLTWDSNLDEFLPSNQQEYQLWEIQTDDNGNEVYVPVYYKNAQGQYTDAQGNVVTEPVPIVLTFNAGDDKVYTQVYVPRQNASQQVTYVIRGQDKADATGKHFLSLKMSNRQSYIIPGKDASEMLLIKDATHYSRFNPQTVTNCYSNKLIVNNNVAGLRADAINGKHLYITRQGLGEDEPTTVATITFNASNKSYTVQMANQAAKTDFPACSSDKSEEPVAGYHANRNNTVGNGQWTGTYDVPSNSNIVDLGKLIIFDNFVVDVSENAHPNLYTYNVTSDYPVQIQSSTANAHSNAFTVPVYKTASQINRSFSQSEVDGDISHGLALDDITFKAKLQYSSKTEILRYDAYRWSEKEARFIVSSADAHDDEQDLPPTGIAGNQDGSYTVSMNDVDTDDYTTGSVDVAMGDTDKWADFVDPVPDKTAGSYVYAPVVETFVTGKNVDETSDRTDYNTYGGPLQDIATATLQLGLAGAVESEYTWEVDGKKYSYYNIKLKVGGLTMPDEDGTYNIYKVRAWRKVDPMYLNESNPSLTADEIASRRARMGDANGEYMFEELGYEEVNASILQNNYVFGQEVFDANHSEDLKMTFGAQRVVPKNYTGDVSGMINELPVEFVVRVYFTLAENLPSQGSGNAAPRRAQAAPKYYVAEKTFSTSMTGENVVTEVKSVNVNREVKSVTYVNSLGMQSSQPFSGVNVVVTRYTDGTTTTTKIVR